MKYLVFAQALVPNVDTEALARNAERYFRATLSTLPQPDNPPSEAVRVELKSPRGVQGIFVIQARPRSPADLANAEAAELRGRAAGMAALAGRCRFVWSVEPEAGVEQTATLMLCAILASVALGPVLPPDGSTLFGVRGAMERVERLLE
jgi:hypothetical protein